MVRDVAVRQSSEAHDGWENRVGEHADDAQQHQQRPVIPVRQLLAAFLRRQLLLTHVHLRRLAAVVLISVAMSDRHTRRVLLAHGLQPIQQHESDEAGDEQRWDDEKERLGAEARRWHGPFDTVVRFDALRIASDTLDEREDGRQKAGESLADEVSDQVDVTEPTEVRHEQHARRAADEGEEENVDEDGDGAFGAEDFGGYRVQERHAESRGDADRQQEVNDEAVADWEELLDERVKHRPDVGDLDDDDDVGCEVPSFRRGVHQQRQLNIRRIDADPRPDTEENRENVHQRITMRENRSNLRQIHSHLSLQQLRAFVRWSSRTGPRWKADWEKKQKINFLILSVGSRKIFGLALQW